MIIFLFCSSYLMVFLIFLGFLEMVVPEVNKSMLEELESMGFPTARATRALHFSGKLFD